MPRTKSEIVKAFCVRVDGEDDEIVKSFFKDESERYIIVHHIPSSGNKHYHAYVETTTSQGNLSNKIKAKLKVGGNGGYSNKKCDPDRAIEYRTYLFNKKLGNQARLVAYDGFSPIDIETYRENSNQITIEFEKRMDNPKKSQFDIVEAVLEKMNSDNHHDPEQVYDVVIKTLRESHKVARPNHVKDIINSVMAFSKNTKANETVKRITLKYFVY